MFGTFATSKADILASSTDGEGKMDSMSGEGGFKLHEINGEEKWAPRDYWKGLTHILEHLRRFC